jgi:hypothetical protein
MSRFAGAGLAVRPRCQKFQLNDHALTGRDGCVRWKDAGSLDSSAIGATEDAPACVPSAFRQPVLILLELQSLREESNLCTRGRNPLLYVR